METTALLLSQGWSVLPRNGGCVVYKFSLLQLFVAPVVDGDPRFPKAGEKAYAWAVTLCVSTGDGVQYTLMERRYEGDIGFDAAAGKLLAESATVAQFCGVEF